MRDATRAGKRIALSLSLSLSLAYLTHLTEPSQLLQALRLDPVAYSLGREEVVLPHR